MAPRRTYRRPARRPRKATAWYNRKYSTLQLAKKAWIATKYLKGLVNSERMYVDNTMAALTSPTQILNCQQLIVGDLSGQRTGNSILARSLYLQGYININPSVTVSTRLSLALVQDTQQIADTVPTTGDIFDGTAPESRIRVGASNNNAGRFKILWRRNYVLIPGQRPTVTFDKYWKLYSHIKYNGASAADIQKNGYYLVLLTSEGTNFPSISLSTRLGYHDN